MRQVEPFNLAGYARGLSMRNTLRMVPERELQVIDRLTDEELPVTDIRAVWFMVNLQQSQTPIDEISAEWWDQVVEGARIA